MYQGFLPEFIFTRLSTTVSVSVCSSSTYWCWRFYMKVWNLFRTTYCTASVLQGICQDESSRITYLLYVLRNIFHFRHLILSNDSLKPRVLVLLNLVGFWTSCNYWARGGRGRFRSEAGRRRVWGKGGHTGRCLLSGFRTEPQERNQRF